MFDVGKYEGAAMIELSDEERAELAERAGSIADGFARLDGIDVEGVEPLVTVLDVCNVMREDVAAKLLSRDEIMANASEEYDGYFKVPGTLE